MKKHEIGGVLCAHPRTYINVSQQRHQNEFALVLLWKRKMWREGGAHARKKNGGGRRDNLYIYICKYICICMHMCIYIYTKRSEACFVLIYEHLNFFGRNHFVLLRKEKKMRRTRAVRAPACVRVCVCVCMCVCV